METLIVNFAHLMVLLLRGYIILIIIRCVAGWMNRFPPRSGPLQLLYRITDPYLHAFSNMLPFLNLGHIDFSPIAGIVVLEILIRMFARAAMLGGLG